jgi:hypothetical protein
MINMKVDITSNTWHAIEDIIRYTVVDLIKLSVKILQKKFNITLSTLHTI